MTLHVNSSGGWMVVPIDILIEQPVETPEQFTVQLPMFEGVDGLEIADTYVSLSMRLHPDGATVFELRRGDDTVMLTHTFTAPGLLTALPDVRPLLNGDILKFGFSQAAATAVGFSIVVWIKIPVIDF